MKKNKIQLFDVIIHIITAFLLIIVMYPMLLVISNSLSDPGMVATGKVLFLPKGFSFDGYIEFFKDKNILTGYGNTFYYAILGTLIDLVVTVPAGYALSKNTLPGNKIFLMAFMFIMYFSGGMIPTFLVVSKLGLYNSRWTLLLLGAFSTYNCIICKSFFDSIPKDLEDAAQIDGCSPMRTFIQVVLPISKALLGVMVLYFGVAHWNSYFNALIYIKDDAKQPLQIFLRRLLILAEQAETGVTGEFDEAMIFQEALLRYSSIVISSLPLMVVYPFLQRYFDKGVLIGAVKQ